MNLPTPNSPVRSRFGSLLAVALVTALAGMLTPSCSGSDGGGSGSPARAGICGDGCGQGEVCDSSLGCVDCLGDSDCGALVCIGGKCEDCRTNAECPEGQACFPREHRCEVACTDDGDCGKDEETCDLESGACVECLDNDGCGGKDTICHPDSGQCVQCAADVDCGNRYCDLKDQKCAECVVDAHCPTIRPECQGGECRAVCTSDSDCGGDKLGCHLDHGHCHECTVDAHCGTEAPFCKGEKDCVACLDDEDCAEGVCADEACVDCRENADCAEGVCEKEACVDCKDDIDCVVEAFPRCEKNSCVAQ